MLRQIAVVLRQIAQMCSPEEMGPQETLLAEMLQTNRQMLTHMQQATAQTKEMSDQINAQMQQAIAQTKQISDQMLAQMQEWGPRDAPTRPLAWAASV